MDGISSASAVVSLTVQLISTTRDIINFLREIKDSPEELRFTIESLDQLHGICEVAKSGLETRIENVDLPPPLVLVSNALKICESKIRLVELCVTKFKLVLDGQSRVRKKWASFKHVLKKGEIQRLQDQLDRATRYLELTLVLNVLQARKIQIGATFSNKMLTMSRNQQLLAQKVIMASSHLKDEDIAGSSLIITNLANVTHVDSATTLDSTLRIRDIQREIPYLSGNSENNKEPYSLTNVRNLCSKDWELRMSSPQSPPHPRVISKESTLIWPLGPLGNVSIQTKSKFVDDGLKVRVPHKRIVSEERSIVFRPSFFKIQYELHSHNRCGRISRTLRSDCVVDFQAPVFDMCRAGDIRGLRDAFYSGSVSLDVVNPLGMGLLHFAAGSFQKDLCSWLLLMGVRADRTSMVGNTALTYMGTRSRIDQTGAVTETMIEIARLLAQAQDDISAFDISMWFREYDGPPEGAELILSQELAQYYICSADDSDRLYPALASVLRLYAKDPEPWEPIIRILVRYRTDLHAPVRRDLEYLDQSEYPCPIGGYGTPLDELFLYTMDSFEGQVAANGWLQVLASEGYDVSAYLETESALHPRPMQLTHPSYRPGGYDNERKLVFDWGARPTVSWDWWISPSSSTFPLREEFRLMAITLPDAVLTQKSWKESWPFIYPEWSGSYPYYDSRKSQDRADARATKRVLKKARKKTLALRYIGSRKIPGAWPI